jgi:hypothetical protein
MISFSGSGEIEPASELYWLPGSDSLPLSECGRPFCFDARASSIISASSLEGMTLLESCFLRCGFIAGELRIVLAAGFVDEDMDFLLDFLCATAEPSAP